MTIKVISSQKSFHQINFNHKNYRMLIKNSHDMHAITHEKKKKTKNLKSILCSMRVALLIIY